MDHSVKTMQPAIELWCEADLLAKQLTESTSAQPGTTYDVQHPTHMRAIMENFKAALDCEMQIAMWPEFA